MHYKNGRLAQVGDLVIGTAYNHKGIIIAGTLVSITPGPDNCSAMVGFLVTVKSEGNILPGTGRYGDIQYGAVPVKVQGTEQHGSAGVYATTFFKQDYTDCHSLLHAEDAFNYSFNEIERSNTETTDKE